VRICRVPWVQELTVFAVLVCLSCASHAQLKSMPSSAHSLSSSPSHSGRVSETAPQELIDGIRDGKYCRVELPCDQGPCQQIAKYELCSSLKPNEPPQDGAKTAACLTAVNATTLVCNQSLASTATESQKISNLAMLLGEVSLARTCQSLATTSEQSLGQISIWKSNCAVSATVCQTACSDIEDRLCANAQGKLAKINAEQALIAQVQDRANKCSNEITNRVPGEPGQNQAGPGSTSSNLPNVGNSSQKDPAASMGGSRNGSEFLVGSGNSDSLAETGLTQESFVPSSH